MATRRKNAAARAADEERAAEAAAAEETTEAEGDARPARRRAVQRQADDGGYDELGGLIAAAAIGGTAIALEAELLPGVLIGAGAVLLGRMFPRVAGMVGGVVRPVLKTAIGAGYALTQGARGAVAEAQEQLQDIVAEVEAERGERRTRRRAA